MAIHYDPFFDCRLVELNGEPSDLTMHSVRARDAEEAAKLACLEWLCGGSVGFDDGDEAIVEVDPDDPDEGKVRFQINPYTQMHFEATECFEETAQ